MKIKKSGFYFLVVVLIFFGIAVYKIFLPFFATLITAFVFWQLFDPLFEKIAKVIGNKKIASFITCVAIVSLIILPLATVGTIAAKEAIELYKNSEYETSSLINFEKKIIEFFAGSLIRAGFSSEETALSLESQLDIGEITKKALEISMGMLKVGYEQSTQLLFLIFIMLFVLYYLFLEGCNFVAYIFRLSPLESQEERILWNRLLSMTRATIKGTLFIGLIQGIMGGLSFWILGIGAPFLLGVIMGIFSALPFVGPIVVWLPVAIWLLVVGETLKAVILLIIGSLIIGSVDNILRPKLVGKETALHPIWILIGTFGGILQFGIMGFEIGPIIMTMFLALLEIFEKKIIKKSD